MSRRLQGESWFSAGDRVKPLGVRVSGGADKARHGEDRPEGGGVAALPSYLGEQ